MLHIEALLELLFLFLIHQISFFSINPPNHWPADILYLGSLTTLVNTTLTDQPRHHASISHAPQTLHNSSTSTLSENLHRLRLHP